MENAFYPFETESRYAYNAAAYVNPVRNRSDFMLAAKTLDLSTSPCGKHTSIVHFGCESQFISDSINVKHNYIYV